MSQPSMAESLADQAEKITLSLCSVEQHCNPWGVCVVMCVRVVVCVCVGVRAYVCMWKRMEEQLPKTGKVKHGTDYKYTLACMSHFSFWMKIQIDI